MLRLQKKEAFEWFYSQKKEQKREDGSAQCNGSMCRGTQRHHGSVMLIGWKDRLLLVVAGRRVDFNLRVSRKDQKLFPVPTTSNSTTLVLVV